MDLWAHIPSQEELGMELDLLGVHNVIISFLHLIVNYPLSPQLDVGLN